MSSSTSTESATCGPAPPEATYTTPEACFTSIQAHARINGYAFRKRDNKPSRKVYVCDRDGQYDSQGKKPYMDLTKQRSNTSTKKCGCKMKVELKKEGSMAWKLTVMEATHNHGPSAAPIAHPAHRIASLDPAAREAIIKYAGLGMGSTQIYIALCTEFPTILIVPSDIVNIIQQARLTQLDGKRPIEWLLKVCK